MNKFVIIGFLFLAGFAFGQGFPKPKPTVCPGMPSQPYSVKGNDTIFSAAAKDLIKPEFPGGLDHFYKLFAAEFKIPMQNPDVKGKIFIKFVVEKDGSITNIKLLRDMGMGTGAEAIRALRQLPRWKPALYRQKTVRCDFSLPIKIPYEPVTSASQLNVKEILDK